MTDASKYPKAAALEKFRKDKFEAEAARQKAAMSIKKRSRYTQAAIEEAAAKVAAKKGKKK